MDKKDKQRKEGQAHKDKMRQWNERYQTYIKELDQESYSGKDLGAIYHPSRTSFRVWAPTAVYVKVNLYKEGQGDCLIHQIDMKKDESGTFLARVEGDLKGLYYTYLVAKKEGIDEAVDPYAKAVGVNGERGMIVDLSSTNPKGWAEDVRPKLSHFTDAVIYEVHVRDVSSDPSSHIVNTGRFLGLAETGTTNDAGFATGLDHMKELGITHLHLMPAFDFATIDESKTVPVQYNWGYDPKNYNVPEGSYSSDPFHGEVRIREMKSIIQALHAGGIRVVLDVVYNHTERAKDSNFNKIVPDYYYRMEDMKYTNGSACGNEMASERSMVRKFIVDSVCYWAKEYHLDGFRFDLMGLHDITTMNEIREKVNAIDPTILLYGEGWCGGESPLPLKDRASKANAPLLDAIAVFSDDIRDAIKGSVFVPEEKGFVHGAYGLEDVIRFGMAGGVRHPQVHREFWASSPSQCINYVSAHDDYTLWDKLTLADPGASEKKRIRMNKLAAAIILTSQGIPFLMAGEELLRTKPGDECGERFDSNSYISSDAINSIKWNDKTRHHEVFSYYQGLIAFRKKHPVLRLTTQKAVANQMHFLKGLERNVVGCILTDWDQNETICILHNGRKLRSDVALPAGKWNVYVDDEKAGVSPLYTIEGGHVTVKATSSMVLIKIQ